MKKRIACLLLTLVMLVSLAPATAITASAASISVSEAGVRVIKEYMGFHKNAYKVSDTEYKIGYGTPSVEGATITEANADQLLREELKEIIGDISPFITVNLVQKRMDALVWLSYVDGTTWTANADLVNAINSNVTGSALVDAFCTFDYDSTGFPDDAASRSVMNHRLAMANLYLNGTYSASNTGSLGFTVFDAGVNAKFTNGAQKMVQAFSGSTVTSITVAEPNYSPEYGTVKFLGWYTGNAMVTGVGPATNGQVLTARWQMPSDDKIPANYTLPAYVIYEANGVADNQEVAIVKEPNNPVQIDVLKRDATVTIIAETSLGGQKWLQLSTGGWVKLCSSLSDVPVIIPSVTVTITDDYVNIRKEPNVNAAKVGTLRRGEQRTIAMLDSTLRWGYCTEGWIFLTYTDYNDKSSAGSGSSLGTGTPGTIVCSSTVNVRTAPGVYNNLATKLSNGTAVTVYEQTTVDNASWGRIDQGWVCMDYVRLSQVQQSGSSISTGASAVVSSSVSLNVRSGPGTIYSKVSTLAPGTSVVILRKETVNGVAWGLIDQGWINLNYVTPTGSSTGTGSTSTYGVGGTVVNCSTGVNIRSAAGTANALVGVAALGSRVTVTELVEVNGYSWGRIDRGWVCMNYIQLDSEFKAPENSQGDGLDNVVTTFEGYPAITLGATELRETASAHANVLMTLNANVNVNILARTISGSNQYGKIVVGDKTGWINLADVQLVPVNAKVTAASADVYELPNTRSKFYASLVKGTYVTVGNADGTGWELSDNVLWGQTTATVGGVTYTGWIKLADVTMFKENTRPAGVTTLSGVGYLTGYITADSMLLKDFNGSPIYYDSYGYEHWEDSAYTLTSGTTVNILARNYVTDVGGTPVKTYGKVTVGSVTGWVDMANVQLYSIVVKAETSLQVMRASDSAIMSLSAGNQFTVLTRELRANPLEINHGVADIGYGYLNDNKTDLYYFVMDDGKLVPTGTATTNDPSNPSVVSSVVVTGTVPSELVVYEETSTVSKQLLKLNGGSNVTILNWKNVDGITWGKVQINKIVGWVKADEVDYSGLKGVVAVDELKVYSFCDKSSSLQVLRVNNKAIDIGTVPYFDGTTLWGYVNVAGYIGWIDLADVTLNTPGISTGVDTSNLPIMAKGKINSVNASVNINGDVKQLPKGTEVSLISLDMTDSGEAWWLVELGEYDGWINMECLTMYSATATITEASAPIYNDLTLNPDEILYTLYRDEKITVQSFHVSGGRLYGEVAYGNTTGWILLCDEADKLYVSLTPGATGSTIGGSTGSTAPTTPTTPAADPVAAYIVCNSTVNVRSGAGVDNALVTTLANGTNVKIYEKTVVLGKEWARIDQGWVCMDYVKLGTLVNVPNGGNNGSSGSVSIMTTVPSGAIAVGYANQDIKIRSGAGLGYPEVGSVSKGYSIVLYENKLDGGMSWGRTDNGWVCTSYLTITGIGATGSGDMGTIGGVGFAANVRLSANSGSALMAKVMITSRVVVRETMNVGSETWVRTDLGWINGQYVTLDSAAAPVPGETTPTEAPASGGTGGEFVG